jgi:hypothetical protein
MYLSDVYTASANLAGIPGISVPCGLSKDLPIGLQLVGNNWSEAVLLNLAHVYENEFPLGAKPKIFANLTAIKIFHSPFSLSIFQHKTRHFGGGRKNLTRNNILASAAVN